MFQLPSNRATRLGFNILILLAAGVALRLCHTVFVPLIIALLAGLRAWRRSRCG